MARRYGDEFLQEFGRVMRPKITPEAEQRALKQRARSMTEYMEQLREEREREIKLTVGGPGGGSALGAGGGGGGDDIYAIAGGGSALGGGGGGSGGLAPPPERVDHPSHYQSDFGIECIDVVENFSFNRGNAMKYIWRAGAKGNEVEDLRKAAWYINREIEKIEGTKE